MMTWLEISMLSTHYFIGEGQGGQKLLYKEERGREHIKMCLIIKEELSDMFV